MNTEQFKKCSAKAVEVMKKRYEPLMNGFIEDLNDVDELAVLMLMLAQRVVANSILLNQEGGVDSEKTMLSILEGSQLYAQDGAAYIEAQVALYKMKKSDRG
jgi:hypothetical protein